MPTTSPRQAAVKAWFRELAQFILQAQGKWAAVVDKLSKVG